MTNGASIKSVYLVVAGAIAIGSLCFSIGMAVGPEHKEEMKEFEERVSKLEKLCERWDERWLNLQTWMARIDSRLQHMNVSQCKPKPEEE